MFVPLHDGVPLRFMRTPYITYGLIGACIALQIALQLWPSQEAELAIMAGFGMIPSVLFGTAQLPEGLAHVPAWATLFTNVLLHANVAHLVGNMLFLWVFGDNVEDAMGHVKFLIFYLLCAAAAAWFHGYLDPHSTGPLIGASGAISGVVASYFLLHPKVRIWVLILWRIPLPLPAFIPLIFWILQQVYMLAVDPDGNVSFAAHVGGIIAGLALTPVLKRWSVPLFDRALVTPKAVELAEPEKPAEDQPEPPRWGRP